MTLTQSDREFLLEMQIQPDIELRSDAAEYLDRLYWENIRLRDSLYFSRNIAYLSFTVGLAVLVWALSY